MSQVATRRDKSLTIDNEELAAISGGASSEIGRAYSALLRRAVGGVFGAKSLVKRAHLTDFLGESNTLIVTVENVHEEVTAPLTRRLAWPPSSDTYRV